MTQFSADTSAVTAWGQQVSNLSDEVGSFVSGAPSTSGVQNSHGAIGYPMQDVLNAAQSARGDALGATQSASAKIGDLLRQAAQAYERGDTAAAGRLKAQAGRMESVETQGGGAQPASQMMGQFGQLAGQMMQGMTQPVQGVVQGLSQIPQQALQGAQGIVQTAMQGAGGGGPAVVDAAAKTSAAGAGPGAGTPGAGAPAAGEKAPVQRGVMSEERMRELQGLPPFSGDRMVHGGDVMVPAEPDRPRLPPIYGDWPNDDKSDSGPWESPPFLPDKS